MTGMDKSKERKEREVAGDRQFTATGDFGRNRDAGSKKDQAVEEKGQKGDEVINVIRHKNLSVE